MGILDLLLIAPVGSVRAIRRSNVEITDVTRYDTWVEREFPDAER